MGVKSTMMDAFNKIRGKMKTEKKGKQTYYGLGKEVAGKEGAIKKKEKKTADIYKELFPEG